MSRFASEQSSLRTGLAGLVAFALHALVLLGFHQKSSQATLPKSAPQSIVIDTIELLADDADSAPAEASAEPPPEPEPPEPEPPVPEPLEPEPPAPEPPAPEPPKPDPIIEQKIADEKIAKQAEANRKAAAKLAQREEAQEKKKVERAKQQAAQQAAMAKQVSRAPVSRNTPQPSYPASARRAGIEGVTTLAFKIDVNGKVVSPRVTRSSGNRDLDRSALQAVSRWSYGPAINRLGQPIATATSIDVIFRLR